MLDHRPHHARRRSGHPPFARILCVVDNRKGTGAAIEQAITLADADASIVFAASWYGKGSLEGGPHFDEECREVVEQAAARAQEAGAQACARYFRTARLADALLAFLTLHDLVVVGAHRQSRATGIVLSELATQFVHRSPIPVLIARDPPLATGVVAATRGVPADRAAITAGTQIAARLGAEMTIVHVSERGDEHRRPELEAEVANAGAVLGRPLDFVKFRGPPARAIVDVAEGDGAGLVVVGSDGKQGLPALRSVSERVAHAAPCSVLVLRSP